MKKSVIPVEDRRLIIADNVYLALEDFAADTRKKMPNEVMASLVTAKSAAQSLLKDAMTTRGYLKRQVRP